MQKVILAILVIAALAVGIPKGLQMYHQLYPDPAIAALAARGHAQQAAAAATKKADAATLAEQQKQAAALKAERGPVETALGTMKVSSLMLGDPAVCIINKQDYSVGDALPLTGGKTVQITSIREDGVGLARNGQTYHLSAPAAPDLAALRKPR